MYGQRGNLDSKKGELCQKLWLQRGGLKPGRETEKFEKSVFSLLIFWG